jgi:Flp pilus assembly protein TadG
MRTWIRAIPLLAGGLGDRGAAAIEFAMVVPILALLFTGVWDFGGGFLQKERLDSAARAGVQYGVQPARATDIAGMIQAARNDAGDAADALTVTAQNFCACAGGSTVGCGATCAGGALPMGYVRVQVSENFATLVTYPFATNPIPLSSSVTLRFQ